MEKVKYSCFGKVSISKVSKEEKQVEVLQKEKMSLECLPKDEEVNKRMKTVDEELATALHNMNSINFEKEIDNLTRAKKLKGKSAAIFKLREKVLGPKESSLDAVAIEEPKDGELVSYPRRIK